MAGPFATLRRQHDELSMLLLETINSISHHRAGDDCFPLVLGIARLVKMLRQHLALEDRWLYPAILASGDGAASTMASRIQRDMGALADLIEDFQRRWSSSAVVCGGFERFRAEALTLFATIEQRIAREDEDLLPLVATLRLATAQDAA